MAFFVTFLLFLYKNQSNLPKTRKIWECFAEEIQQVRRKRMANFVFLALVCHTNYSMAFFTMFWLFLYKNQSNLPETQKIWECFAEETQQVRRRCIAKLRADVEVENRWLCTYKKKRCEGLEN